MCDDSHGPVEFHFLEVLVFLPLDDMFHSGLQMLQFVTVHYSFGIFVKFKGNEGLESNIL